MQIKIITIVGARPQFIKAAVVSREISKRGNSVKEILLHTGQHFDANMSDVFFDELQIPKPHFNLGIGGGTHGQNTGRMIEQIEAILLQEKPHWLLVYGDTDSTLAGAIAASKLHIPIIHVEAGLRSFNRRMPEEINRILTDHVSSLCFTPTQTADRNLINEGVQQEKIVNVGDVMYDAALFYAEKSSAGKKLLDELAVTPKAFNLLTFHRAENTDSQDRMQSILNGIAGSPLPVIWPTHPRTKKTIEKFGLTVPGQIKMIEPVGYLDMVLLEKNSSTIITDSGGVQKEAYFHRVPCITLRNETEWTELVEVGVNTLVGSNDKMIREALQTFRVDNQRFDSNLYGDGHAAEKIINAIERYKV